MPDEPKLYVVGRVREALAEDPRVNDLNIDITVAGNKVYLTGSVLTQERHDAISQVVSELLPDCEVHNQTTVNAYPETHSVETLP